tara:strand:- start:874 stop:1041 length:168 start_codon:yes stop_codon:yes gene_type:complete
MPKIKGKRSYYVVTNEKNFTYGAFDLDEEGLKKAKKHIKKLKKKVSGKFFIKEVK